MGPLNNVTGSVRPFPLKIFLNLTLIGTLPKNDESTSCSNVVHPPVGEILGSERISREGRVYHAFFGIPYAKPPLGNLRFQPPVPIPKFEAKFNATVRPKNCLQNLDPYSSEDCLYLDVFRPKAFNNSCAKKTLPVLFYVYGGAFSAGNPGPDNNADYLMDEDVILVSPNYRLGVFGFPTFGNNIMPGNYGLKDLVLALTWVKENIPAFGGDPDNLTVFGGSAGGALSHILLKSPASENLVTRAFSYSGTINPIWSQLDPNFVKTDTLQVAAHIKCCKTSETCATNQEVFECMQRANASDLLKGATIVSMGTGIAHLLPFTAVLEAKDVPAAVITEDLSLRPSKKPWMTSISSGEFSVFIDILSTTMSDEMAKGLEAHLSVMLKDIIRHHTNESRIIKNGSKFLKKRYFHGDFLDGFSKMFMDYYFIYPQMFNIKRHAGPKWMSDLEYKGELSMGEEAYPGHADQGIFIFNYRDLYPRVPLNETDDDYRMIKRMIGYLVNFAKYSDPAAHLKKPLALWKPFTKHEVLRMTREEDFMGSKDFFKSFEDVYNGWSEIIGWSTIKE